jgi:hypothetical protein
LAKRLVAAYRSAGRVNNVTRKVGGAAVAVAAAALFVLPGESAVAAELVEGATKAVFSTFYVYHARSKFHLDPLDDAALTDPDTRIKLAFLYAALANTREVHIHQMRGASKNRVFVSPDGHHEAVYDEQGKLVTDCANKASYNFFPFDREPLEHFLFDMLPWIDWGNCRLDPTTPAERIDAYLQDFRNGAIDVFNGHPASLPVNVRFNGNGQSEAAAFFLRVLEDTPASEISTLYTSSATEADFHRFFGKFSRAFSRMWQ